MRRASMALVQAGDTFHFNGLRYQQPQPPYYHDERTQLRVEGIDLRGDLIVHVSPDGDSPFIPAGIRVPILTALELIETKVWQEVES